MERGQARRPQGNDKALPDTVWREERAAVLARRHRERPVPEAADDTLPVPPGLTGLSLSGGGIRSATFNLGVLQALDRAGLLGAVDYLSTVSGGGYIGSCLSSCFASLGQAGRRVDRSALRLEIEGFDDRVANLQVDGRPGRQAGGRLVVEAVDRCHRLSFELAPGDRPLRLTARVSGMLRITGSDHEEPAGVALRLPRDADSPLSVEETVDGDEARLEVTGTPGPAQKVTVMAAVTDNPFPFRHRTGAPESPAFIRLREHGSYLIPRRPFSRWRLPGLLLRGLVANLAMLLPLLLLAAWITWYLVPASLAPAMAGDSKAVTALFDDWYLFALMMGGAYLAVLVGYLVAQKLVGPASTLAWRDWGTRYVLGLGLLLVGLVLLAEVQPLAIYGYHRLAGNPDAGGLLGDRGEMATALATVVSLLASLLSKRMAETEDGGALRGRLRLYALGALGPLVLWLIYLTFSRWAVYPESAPALLDLLPVEVPLQLLVAGIVLLILVGGVIDVNRTSLHRFYRDRLSEAYLFDPWSAAEAKDLAGNDTQVLSGLKGGEGPYHLINTTLNIPHADTANARGRDGEFFLFSPLYIGSPLTGYCRTEGQMEPAVDLGTAMAISGAAAAPNMGTRTQKSLTFLLAMLNVRLGYWLPNPQRFEEGTLRRLLPLRRAGPVYFYRELLGRLDGTRARVNVTDGGHIENLGIYELVRRGCRFIIACDAEADPDMQFEGLAQAVRLVRIDFGVKINIDVESLRLDPEGWSGMHCAVGTIDYGDGVPGRILYLKASMTGDEDVHIRHYRDTDPSFPHQTTADQFFDEAQFEAYRALGLHVGGCLLDGKEHHEEARRFAAALLEAVG